MSKYKSKEKTEWQKARDSKKIFFLASAIVAIILIVMANFDKIKGLF